jgi:hypothetical protein
MLDRIPWKNTLGKSLSPKVSDRYMELDRETASDSHEARTLIIHTCGNAQPARRKFAVSDEPPYENKPGLSDREILVEEPCVAQPYEHSVVGF